MVFIDLEKAYDRVPRQEVWRCTREKGVPEKYVMIIQDMYEGVRTRVKRSVGLTDDSSVYCCHNQPKVGNYVLS